VTGANRCRRGSPATKLLPPVCPRIERFRRSPNHARRPARHPRDRGRLPPRHGDSDRRSMRRPPPAVGRRGKPYLVQKDTIERIAGQQLAKAGQRLRACCRIVGAGEAECLRNLRPLFRPAAPAPAPLPPPVDDQIRVRHSGNIGENVVPKEYLFRRATAGIRYQAKCLGNLPVTDDQDIEDEHGSDALDDRQHMIDAQTVGR